MRLMIAIINNPDHVMDIMDEFYKINIKGSTVMDSVGMAHLMAHHVPFFARFAELGGEPGHNKTIFTVVHSDDCLERAVRAIEKIVGDLNKPDSGVVLTIPVDFCKGMDLPEGTEKLK